MSLQIAIRDANVPLDALEKGASIFDALRALNLSSFELHISPDNNPGEGNAPLHLPGEGNAPLDFNSDEGIRIFGSRIEEEGASVAALMLSTDFAGPHAKEHVRWAIRMAQVARALGAPVVRLDPVAHDRSLSPETVRAAVVRGAHQVLSETQDTGVVFGLENHGVLGNSRAFLDGVLEEVGDARLGMTLDIANFYWSGLPLGEVYMLIEHFAPRTHHTHIKSIHYPLEVREQKRAAGWEYGRYASPLDEGDLDLNRIVRILRDANYDGALCIENEALGRYRQEEQLEVLRRDVRALREAVANG